jgi:hypothetical protein
VTAHGTVQIHLIQWDAIQERATALCYLADLVANTRRDLGLPTA